jgi:hypothetical protein
MLKAIEIFFAKGIKRVRVCHGSDSDLPQKGDVGAKRS